MNTVTYKAISKVWKYVMFASGCGILYGVAMNHGYKKTKSKIEELEGTIDTLKNDIRRLNKRLQALENGGNAEGK